MIAIVLGATGATGKELVRQFIENPKITEVIAVVRRMYFQPEPKLRELLIDFEEMEKYNDEMKADLAFSALGTTLKAAGSKEAQWSIDFDYQLKFAEICEKNNVNCFALISATGANSKSKIFYSQMKGELENAVKALKFKKLIIAQPASLIRPNSDRKMEVFSSKIASFITGMGILKSYTPVSTEKLAQAVISATFSVFDKIKILDVKEILRFSEK